MSHPRNMAFKLSTGDIACNVDPDNFSGKGFADFVNASFKQNDHIFLSTHGNEYIYYSGKSDDSFFIVENSKIKELVLFFFN